MYTEQETAKVTPGIPTVQVVFFFFLHQTSESSHFVVTCAGFHTEGGGGGGAGILPPPRNLEIEYGSYCFVTGVKQQSCPRLRQKQSKFKSFLGEGGHAPRPP